MLLCIAGVGCCVAMAMPQVHIVAYCAISPRRARSRDAFLMLACGLVSRISSGLVADRIGGAATLLLGSALQGLALFLYLLFDGLACCMISALFGLFQGGIVDVCRARAGLFPRARGGTRLGIVLMATLLGMALGGWMSGMIFDLTGALAPRSSGSSGICSMS
jgi:hypothetical protein